MYEDNGSQFERELHKEGVPYKFVWNTGRVRENYKFIDRKSMLTEVVENPVSVSSQKEQELIALIGDLSKTCSAIVLSGAFAKGMSVDFYSKVLSAIPKDVVRIVDSEGDRLNYALSCGVDLVKPNLDELERTVKRKITSKQEMLECCQILLDRGAKRVLLSLGKSGAVITDGTKNYYCKSINVAMNSTIGAGDGMVAGATNALLKDMPLKEILRCGVAAGSAAVTSPNSISFSRGKAKEILTSLTVEEI
jgi:1-phosphofructokinase family hexose kinase